MSAGYAQNRRIISVDFIRRPCFCAVSLRNCSKPHDIIDIFEILALPSFLKYLKYFSNFSPKTAIKRMELERK